MNSASDLLKGFFIRGGHLHDNDRFILIAEEKGDPNWQPGTDTNTETFAFCYDGRKDEWTKIRFDSDPRFLPAATGPSLNSGKPETVFLNSGGLPYMLNSVVYSYSFENGAKGGVANVIDKDIIRRMSAAAYIDDTLYIVGGEQAVARRTPENIFEQIHFKPGGRSVLKHEDWFAIAGFSENDIYTTGEDRGEGSIFHFDGTSWKALTVPPSIEKFRGRAIVKPDNRNLYFVSIDAKVLYGNATDGLEVIANPPPLEAPFVEGASELVWFKGKLYLSTLEWLFVLDGDKWTPTKSEAGFQPVSFKGLSTNGEMLLQYGETGASLYDGETWTKIYSEVTLEDLVRKDKLEEQLEKLGEGVDIMRKLRGEIRE